MAWLDQFKQNLLEILYRPDQPRDERGRWVSAGGGASFVEESLVKGGFSYQPITKLSPTDGCMVSLHPRFGGEHVVGMPDGSPAEVREFVHSELNKFVQQHVGLLKENLDLYVGGWIDDGKFYFDISENLPADDMRNVVMKAIEREQKGVYNVETGDYITEDDYWKYL